MKILIVDDDERIRQMIKTLAGDQVIICECSNGAEAYASYAEQEPDWVLLMEISRRPKWSTQIIMVGRVSSTLRTVTKQDTPSAEYLGAALLGRPSFRSFNCRQSDYSSTALKPVEFMTSRSLTSVTFVSSYSITASCV